MAASCLLTPLHPLLPQVSDGGASLAKVHEVPSQWELLTVGRFLQKDLFSSQNQEAARDASCLLFFIYSCTHVPKKTEATYSKNGTTSYALGQLSQGIKHQGQGTP